MSMPLRFSYGNYAAVQKEVFKRQLKIAVDMQLPLVIHCREAEDDCLEILEEVRLFIFRVCSTMWNWDQVTQAVKMMRLALSMTSLLIVIEVAVL
jgi:Tat protein secretion system quality control protein TatD with DNase activity